MGDFICSICGQPVSKPKTRNPLRCSRCYYRAYKTPKAICSRCGKTRHIKKRIDAAHVLCASCHSKDYQKTYIRRVGKCCICGHRKRVHACLRQRPVCSACYARELQPKEICAVCGRLEPACCRTEVGIICQRCYTTPVECCSACKEARYVHKRGESGPVCDACYQPPIHECTWCGKDRAIFKKIDDDRLCKVCYERWRMDNDPKFRTIKLLRKRLRNAFFQFSRTGKVRPAKDYGIDYVAIFHHLGPCPGKFSDYHIDHVFPLACFDFDNETQIRAAFAPENHQWLKRGDNLRKQAKYDAQAFGLYLQKYQREQ